jgi:ABC-type antimicrobial peptide transport system permease subunit
LGLIGTAIGLVGCLAVTRLVASLLYRISPSDPWTLAGGSIVLVIVTILASWVPAQRAAKIDPIEALRYE